MQKSPHLQKNLQKCIQKNPPRVQIQGAAKAEGLQHKENPGPVPLPGKNRYTKSWRGRRQRRKPLNPAVSPRVGRVERSW